MPPQIEPVAEKIVEIGKGELQSVEFTARERCILHLFITLRDGPKVDLYTTDERGFSNYLDGMRFKTYDKLSQENLKQFESSIEIQPGSYAAFVENNGRSGLLASITKGSTATVDIQVGLESIY